MMLWILLQRSSVFCDYQSFPNNILHQAACWRLAYGIKLKRKKLKEGAVPSLFMEFDPFQPKNERNQPKNENNQPKNEKEPPQELEEGEVTLEMLNEYNMKIENESIIETELVTNSSQGYLY